MSTTTESTESRNNQQNNAGRVKRLQSSSGYAKKVSTIPKISVSALDASEEFLVTWMEVSEKNANA